MRRIEAMTGRGAFRYFSGQEDTLETAAGVLKTKPDNLVRRVEQLLAEKSEIEDLLKELRFAGGGGESRGRPRALTEAQGP